MLRITSRDSAEGVTLKLEGRLAGAWVTELEDCWRQSAAALDGRSLWVDLTGVDCADTAGRYLLILMHNAGAKFIAPGCVMAALVADIADNWCGAAGTGPRRD
jgi:anti-anti-sigma regulatory factor